jgi:hypothetical protein
MIYTISNGLDLHQEQHHRRVIQVSLIAAIAAVLIITGLALKHNINIGGAGSPSPLNINTVPANDTQIGAPSSAGNGSDNGSQPAYNPQGSSAPILGGASGGGLSGGSGNGGFSSYIPPQTTTSTNPQSGSISAGISIGSVTAGPISTPPINVNVDPPLPKPSL